MHEYEVSDQGMRLLGPIHGIRGILAGLAEVTGETPQDEPATGAPG
jgi:hypothetical protein